MEFGRYRGDPVQEVELQKVELQKVESKGRIIQKVESKGRITKGRIKR